MQKNIGVAVLAAFTILLILWPHKTLTPAPSIGAPPQAMIGGAFTLTDTAGRVVHDTDFHGRPVYIYMGYTRCPDICPATLITMGNALKLLGDHANRVTMAFITLDSGHDTPQVMAEYLKQFDPRLVGLTGTKEQIDQVVKNYKAFYAPAAPSSGSAAIEHSGLIYMMDGEGRYIRHFDSGVTPEMLMTAYHALQDQGHVPAASGVTVPPSNSAIPGLPAETP